MSFTQIPMPFDSACFDWEKSNKVHNASLYFEVKLMDMFRPWFKKVNIPSKSNIILYDVANYWRQFLQEGLESESCTGAEAQKLLCFIEKDAEALLLVAVKDLLKGVTAIAVPAACVVVPDDRDKCSVPVEPEGANVTSAGDETSGTSTAAPSEESVASCVVAPVVDDAPVVTVTDPMVGCAGETPVVTVTNPMVGGGGATQCDGASCETSVATDVLSPYPPTADVDGWRKNLLPEENEKQVAEAFKEASKYLAFHCGFKSFAELVSSIPSLGKKEARDLFDKFAFIQNDDCGSIKINHGANTKDFDKVFSTPWSVCDSIICKLAFGLTSTFPKYFADRTNVRNAVLFVIEFVMPLVLIPLLERMTALGLIKYIPLESNPGFRKYGCVGYTKKQYVPGAQKKSASKRHTPAFILAKKNASAKGAC